MQRRGSSDKWTFGLGDPIGIDFAVWVLEVDGMRVGPFNRHGEGSGELRALGLDQAGWDAWVAAMVDPYGRGKRWLPVDQWSGDSAIREQLDHLWQVYCPLSQRRVAEIERDLNSAPCQEMVSHLWHDLGPYHDRIPSPLSIALVKYLDPVEYLLPPSSFILGFSSGLPEPSELRSGIIAACRRLEQLSG